MMITTMIGHHRSSNPCSSSLEPRGGGVGSSFFPAFSSQCRVPVRGIASPPPRGILLPPSSSSRGWRRRWGRSSTAAAHDAAHDEDDEYATTDSSRERAERHLLTTYPKFCKLLYSNPTALERMRSSSSSGYAVFAPNDGAFDALGRDRLNMLDMALSYTAVDDDDVDVGISDMRDVVMAMAEYHMVSAPVTSDVMMKFGVVTTSMGEMNVDVDDDGTMYVNGVRVVRSYQYEDRSFIDYIDSMGNSLGTEEVSERDGKEGRCIVVHEVDGLVCPEVLWDVIYDIYYRYSSSLA
ncbi:hypothetical protein ACHAXA_011296 [Cyclostephanos tholiformis]|uniref:FAS1 domain-containing protein n=1 Tax=Cyclostephanos tholiformis TaxID=382380 RepID=A0ABD3RG80_9STRA